MKRIILSIIVSCALNGLYAQSIIPQKSHNIDSLSTELFRLESESKNFKDEAKNIELDLLFICLYNWIQIKKVKVYDPYNLTESCIKNCCKCLDLPYLSNHNQNLYNIEFKLLSKLKY